jgi:hypothetical protein
VQVIKPKEGMSWCVDPVVVGNFLHQQLAQLLL